MRKKPLLGLFLILIIGMNSLPTLAQNNAEFIRETWRLDGTLPPNGSGNTFTWFLEWTFSGDGTFRLTGYPPLSQKGKYKILKEDNDKLTLELYEQSGNFGTKNKQIEILIDKEKETLKIEGKEGFKRTRKKTN